MKARGGMQRTQTMAEGKDRSHMSRLIASWGYLLSVSDGATSMALRSTLTIDRV